MRPCMDVRPPSTAQPGPSRPARDPDALVETIRSSVIGDDEAVAGPFGVRRVTYADYTASGRSLTFIEDYIRDAVLPLYANTHTESSGTGLQTTRFREEARDTIRRAVGGSDDHAVIFTGSGSTSAVNKLVLAMGLRIPAELDERYGLSARIPAERAAGRLRRTVRASQQRAAMARVDRRRRRHPRGRRRAHRSGPPRRGVAPLRRSAAPHRQLQRGLERDRASSPTRTASPACSTSTARCRSGISRRRPRTSRSRWTRRATRSPTRTRSSSRPTSSSAGRARRGSSSPAASCSGTGSRRSPAAAPSRT